jgi:hypothetical protein
MASTSRQPPWLPGTATMPTWRCHHPSLGLLSRRAGLPQAPHLLSKGTVHVAQLPLRHLHMCFPPPSAIVRRRARSLPAPNTHRLTYPKSPPPPQIRTAASSFPRHWRSSSRGRECPYFLPPPSANHSSSRCPLHLHRHGLLPPPAVVRPRLSPFLATQLPPPTTAPRAALCTCTAMGASTGCRPPVLPLTWCGAPD